MQDYETLSKVTDKSLFLKILFLHVLGLILIKNNDILCYFIALAS